nr:MAG TPA: hypothetical protein [Caudoviricetes sp.]
MRDLDLRASLKGNLGLHILSPLFISNLRNCQLHF